MNPVLLSGALLSMSVGLVHRPPAARRRLVSAATDVQPTGRVAAAGTVTRGQLGPPAAAALAGLAVAVVVGGWVGVIAAPVAALGVHRVISRLEPAAVRRRRLRIAADLPLAADLLVVCLTAGRPVAAAVAVVGDAVGGPLGQELTRAGRRVELGADPTVVWSDTGRVAALGPLARAITRALDSGAPVAESLTALSADLRHERRAVADEAARRVAVRSAGPLGLCFLPAFVLVGIVPTIIGAFRTLLV